MADLELFKVDLNTPQPNGRLGETPRAAFTKYNDLIDEINGGVGVASVIAGNNITIDTTDPTNPIVSASFGVATILGVLVNESELPLTGSAGDVYIIGSNMYVWDETLADWANVGPFIGPQGPQGIQGATGPSITSAEFSGSDIVFTLDDLSTVPLIDAAITLKGLTGDQGDSAYQVWLDQGNVGSESDFLLDIKGDQGEQGIQGVQGETGPQGPTGLKGDTGDSAYEEALNNGFVGTESEWLASLVGPKGDVGDTGPQGLQGDTGPIGETGDSAYEEAVANGFIGTESEWLESLIGPKGETGAIGPEGPQGIQGIQGEQGETGATGDKGWSPVLSLVSRNDAFVLEITDWIGGQGTKPTDLGYIGLTGIVSDINDGINVRGPAGTGTGNVNTSGTVSDLDVAVFDGVTGTLIKSGGILGSAAFTLATDFATAAQGAKADSAVQSVVAGENVTVDITDPLNPIVSADGGGGAGYTFNKESRAELLFEMSGPALQTSQGAFIWVEGNIIEIASGATVSLPTLSSHTDYKIWVDTAGALSAQPWDDPDPASSRWIGGFHAYHTDATVNPYSLWDLGYRPKCNPRAMAIAPDKRVWFDIYLMDTSYGVNGYSRGNAQIADDGSRPIIPAYFGGDGVATYAGMMWWHAVDLAVAAGKRLPFYGEFIGAAYGVVENSARGTDPVTTGKDASFRSAIGLEQVTGCLWQWAADIAGTGGSSWTSIADGRGQVYQQNLKAALLGVSWNFSTQAGSRASRWLHSPAVSSGYISARAACDHLYL